MKNFIDFIGKKILAFTTIVGEMIILLGQTLYFFKRLHAILTV